MPNSQISDGPNNVLTNNQISDGPNHNLANMQISDVLNHDLLNREIRDGPNHPSQNPSQGRTMGYPANEWRAVYFRAAYLGSDEASVIASQLHYIGYSAHEMETAGLTAMPGTAIEYLAAEDRTVGFPAADGKAVGFVSKAANDLASQVQQVCYSAREACDSVSEYARYSARDSRHLAIECTEANFIVSHVRCAGDAVDHKSVQLQQAGLNACELEVAGLTEVQCRVARDSAIGCKAAELGTADCKAFDYSVSKVHDVRSAVQSMLSKFGITVVGEQMLGNNVVVRTAASDTSRMSSLQSSFGTLQNTQGSGCSSSIRQGDVEECLRRDICSDASCPSVDSSGSCKDTNAPVMRLATGSTGILLKDGQARTAGSGTRTQQSFRVDFGESSAALQNFGAGESSNDLEVSKANSAGWFSNIVLGCVELALSHCRTSSNQITLGKSDKGHWLQEKDGRSIDGNIEIESGSSSRSSLGSFSVRCSDNQFGGLVHPPHQFNYSDNRSIRSSSSETSRFTDNPNHPGSLDIDIADSLAPTGSNEGLGGDANASMDAIASMHHLHMPPTTLCSAKERSKVDELEGREPRWVGASSQPISQPEPLSEGLIGRFGLSAMPSGGATLVPDSFSDNSQCVPCNNFIGVVLQVDSRGDIISNLEGQDTYIDRRRDNSEGRFDVPHVAASSSTTPAPENVNHIWSPLFTWGAHLPVAAEPANQPVGVDNVGHYVADRIFKRIVETKVTGKHVQVQIVEAPGEWPIIEGARPWLGDHWCPEYSDVYIERGQSNSSTRDIACGLSLYVYQLKPTGWKAYVLKEQKAKRKKEAKLEAKMQAEDEARRLEEQQRQQEEQQQQLRRRRARMIGAKPSNYNNLFYQESLWPPAGAGVASIAPGCNAAIEPKRPQVERRIRSRRRFTGFCNNVSLDFYRIKYCGSDEPASYTDAAGPGPWKYALPRTQPMYNKLCRDPRDSRRTVVRNIRIDYHADKADKVVGNVYRRAHDTMMEIHEGHSLGTELSWRIGSDLKGRVQGGHHSGRDRTIPGAHKDSRFVYIDVRKMHWATFGNIAFQGFAWPFEAKKCKSIVRALFSNHCRWADILVVRGRCFSSQPGRFSSNRVLENLLWHWRFIGRPYLVYKEGCTSTGDGDPVPKWIVDSECYCSDFCQCSLVSQGQGQGAWHHPGQIFSNVSALNVAFDRSGSHCIFKCDCDHSQVKSAYPPGSYSKHSKNQVICANLCMALAHAPGFEPKVPIEYHPYQYQNKDWYAAMDDTFYPPSDQEEIEEWRALRIADWQDRLAKEDQQERKIA